MLELKFYNVAETEWLGFDVVGVTIQDCPVPEEFREQIRLNFDSIDVNDDGVLSFEEVGAFASGLTNAQFSDLDTDGDGSLSNEELQSGVAEGEGEGERPPGVTCNMTQTKLNIQKYLGDLFLLGIALVTLLGLNRRK